MLISAVAMALAAFQWPADPMLRERCFQITAMYMTDQEARMRIIKLSNERETGELMHAIHEMGEIDRHNTREMKKMVLAYGWPTISEYGQSFAGMAHILVQHADHDLPFQRKVLRLMTPMVDRGDVDATSYAYLWDRVAVNSKQKQRYGTQGYFEGRKYILRPVEDPKNLDKRRAKVGLGTSKDYIKMVEKFYFPKD